MRNGAALRALAMALALLAGAGQASTHEAFSPCPDPQAAPPYQPVRNDILNEGFEGSFPPAGWAVIHLGSTFTWERNGTFKHSGAYSARVHYGSPGLLQDEYLVTPALDFSALQSAYLEFYEKQDYWPGFGEHHYIAASTTSQTDPAAFTMLVDWTPANHEIGDFTADPVTLALQAYAGEPVVYLAFRYYGDYADDWYIDDVRVYEPFDHDLALLALTPDGEQFAAGGTIAPSVLVTNKGALAEDFDVELRIEESGTLVYSEILSHHLEPAEQATLDFPDFLAAAGHYYHLHAEALLPADEAPGDNSREASCDSYTLPHVPLGWFHTNAGCGYCAAPEFAFDAWLPGQGSSVASDPLPHLVAQRRRHHVAAELRPEPAADLWATGRDFTPHFWIDGVVDLG